MGMFGGGAGMVRFTWTALLIRHGEEITPFGLRLSKPFTFPQVYSNTCCCLPADVT